MTDDQDETESGVVMQEDYDHQQGGDIAESWQETLPPDDDFHDSADETAEAHEELELPQNSFEGGLQTKKKGSSIFFGALVVGFVFLLGMAYMQFSGGDTPSLPANTSIITTQKTADIGGATVSENKQEYPSLTPTTGETDMDSLLGTNKNSTNMGGTTVLPGREEERPADKPDSVKTQYSDVITNTPPSVTEGKIAFPKLQGFPQMGASAPDIGEDKIKVQIVGQEQSNSGLDNKIDELANQIDDLKKSFEQITQQISQMKEKPETAQNSSSSVSTSAIEDRLKNIEQQIAEVSAMPRTINSSRGVELGETSVAEIPLTPTKEMRQVEQKKPKVKKASVAKTKKRTKPQEKAAKKQAEPRSWVLRAATPEAAWVASDSNSSDLQRVEVGDVLPGIGRINSIRQIGDNWSVVGSNGTIR